MPRGPKVGAAKAPQPNSKKRKRAEEPVVKTVVNDAGKSVDVTVFSPEKRRAMLRGAETFVPTTRFCAKPPSGQLAPRSLFNPVADVPEDQDDLMANHKNEIEELGQQIATLKIQVNSKLAEIKTLRLNLTLPASQFSESHLINYLNNLCDSYLTFRDKAVDLIGRMVAYKAAIDLDLKAYKSDMDWTEIEPQTKEDQKILSKVSEILDEMLKTLEGFTNSKINALFKEIQQKSQKLDDACVKKLNPQAQTCMAEAKTAANQNTYQAVQPVLFVK